MSLLFFSRINLNVVENCLNVELMQWIYFERVKIKFVEGINLFFLLKDICYNLLGFNFVINLNFRYLQFMKKLIGINVFQKGVGDDLWLVRLICYLCWR